MAASPKLRPCGTYAAYRRHLRRGEEPCEPCKQAARDQTNERNGLRPRAEEEGVVTIVPDVDPLTPPDPLADALDNLRIVNEAMNRAVPREIAPLSKRRQELVQLISELGSKGETSLHDQLAAARRARASRA
ncbi:hypothetical protein SEA_BAILEYBLU_1 [Arthrobacter phage BaileyBlu]|uniref:Uncharacterized protein n=1 Tax=Arthrobacter phage BaileyBlu TaxID=2910754 RepID=A0AA49BPB7_9CAUD|nr:transcriptional regulator WhiB-like [Arthrobacter phage BaileyBlu]UJQ87140.1 hypothetical protein SEA_BAILEYBLU_1 [Arthrobacter phage BaileyBlu]